MCWCWILELSFYNYSCSGIITFDLPLIANSTTVLVVVPCTVQRRVVLPVVVFAAVELTKVSTGPLGSMKKILRYDYDMYSQGTYTFANGTIYHSGEWVNSKPKK